MEDTQAQPDNRNLPIQRVGIKNIRYPVTVSDDTGQQQSTIAVFDLAVELPADQKGTHMSRFVETLNRFRENLSPAAAVRLAEALKSALKSERAYTRIEFPYFMEKSAPMTGSRSLMDYTIILDVDAASATDLMTTIRIPVTTLCPCSKSISEYGAHNQRGLVQIQVRTNDLESELRFGDLIRHVEETSSCEVFALLKREDEKYVTERAYENPVFVEDLVRDIALRLSEEPALSWFKVEVTNFESIHNHDAYATIDSAVLKTNGAVHIEDSLESLKVR